MRLDNALREAQSDSIASRVFGTRAIDPIEGLEHARKVLLPDALASVVDLEQDFLTGDLKRDANRRTPWIGVAQRVRQQVGENDANPLCVYRRYDWPAESLESDARRVGGTEVRGLLHELRQVSRGTRQPTVRGVEPFGLEKL